MTKIILNEAAQYGIKGAIKKKPKTGKKYQKLVSEANKKIDEDYFYYTYAYKKAFMFLAR